MFVSRPIDLSPTQRRSLRLVEKRLRNLGFELMTFELGDFPEESLLSEVYALARWNQIEAGVLFGLGLPLLIFREEGVEGGVFTEGSSGFVHLMPGPRMNRDQGAALDNVLLNWSSRVRSQYYRGSTQ